MLVETRRESDEEYLRGRHVDQLGREPDFADPQTFNEKLMWLSLYRRDPILTTLSDKFAVRAYVEERVGKHLLVPVLGIYERVEQIDFDGLPDRFVMKATHGSGWNLLVRDKSELDWDDACSTMRRWLRRDYYAGKREWRYRDVPSRIIVEEMLQDEQAQIPPDYKLHCLRGRDQHTVFVDVVANRFGNYRRSLYDLEWRRLPVAYSWGTADQDFPRPAQLDEMVEVSKRLSRDFAYVRVDLYCVAGRIYFGELTFTPAACAGTFEPPEWDRTWGDLIDLER